MALTLVVETGAGDNPAANTYISRADADTYHEGVIDGTAWTDETEGDRDKALAHAARILETQFRWKGQRSFLVQPLAWPRSGVISDGVIFEETDMPKAIKDAQCEIARELLVAGAFQTRPANSGGADQLAAIDLGRGALKLEYQDQSPTAANSNADKTVVSPYVVALLRDFGSYQQGGDRMVRVRRA